MDQSLLIEIEKLRRASVAALRDKYREVFLEPTRCANRDHLFRRIAWRLQSLAEGDLTERARQRALQIARDADLRIIAPQEFFDGIETAPVDPSAPSPDSRLPLAGTLLTREWKGQSVLVEVLEKGFRYEGRQYSSLSAVAEAVTGTRWNGLAFFKLTRRAAERKERSHAKK